MKTRWNATEWHNTTADEQDVELIVRDRRPVDGLSKLEQRMITRQLTALDVSAADIARIIGRTTRTVCRWRAADRSAA